MKITLDANATFEISGIRVGPNMTQQQAEHLYALGSEVVLFVMMTQSQIIA